MNIKSVHAIYFSPAYTTKKLVSAIAYGICENVIDYDISLRTKRKLNLSKNDVVVIGVPSFSGRVPKLAKQYISEILGNGASAIIICTYGNRAYEDTLIELKAICIGCDFNVISAAAFISRHSIFPNIAANRPNLEDLEKAKDFGRKSAHSLFKKQEINIRGNQPYREIKPIPLKPKVSSKCDLCGTCITLCPVSAISRKNPKKTNKQTCISCTRCIEICPRKARHFSGIIYRIAKSQFAKKYNTRKENEFFF